VGADALANATGSQKKMHRNIMQITLPIRKINSVILHSVVLCNSAFRCSIRQYFCYGNT
jgi:hypothetical protein